MDPVALLKLEYQAITTFKNQKTWYDFAYGVVLPRYNGRLWWTPNPEYKVTRKQHDFASALRTVFTRNEFLEFAERVTRQLPRPKGFLSYVR